MDQTLTYDLDEQFMHEFITEVYDETPAGLIRISSIDKSYTDIGSDGIFESTTETIAINGKATTIYDNIQTQEKTITSPEGRVVTQTYDLTTLLTTGLSIPGLYDTNYGYDTKGRLTSVTTDSRQTDFTYNTDGFLESITDPENQTTSYTYDDVGRVTQINRPDTSSLWFSYDFNGNMTVLTNPSIVDHSFGFNAINLNNSYETPLSGSYSYVYDFDRRLSQINFPFGGQINKKGVKSILDLPIGLCYFPYYGTLTTNRIS